MDKIYPSYVKIKYNYLNIDNMYVSTICIIKYGASIKLIDTINMLNSMEEIEVSFHFKRENNAEFLKKLTNIIAQSSSEIKSISDNQIDINVIDNLKQRAKELRRKIQIDNEQIYLVSTYILVKDKDISMLIDKVNRVINNLYSKQMVARPCNFNQKEAYLATLPLLANDNNISKYTSSVFTENAVAKLFPYFTETIFEKTGVIVGNTNGKLCAIDLLSKNHNNHNACIFGASGAGKSYFVKLMIIKNAYKGVKQIIIDPEGEYTSLVRSLGGTIYNKNSYNPFEIDEDFLQNENFFDHKVEQVTEYILEVLKLQDRQKVQCQIKELYKEFGINEYKESLYEYNNENTIYMKPKFKRKFPNLKAYIEKYSIKNNMKVSCEEGEEFSINDSKIYSFNLQEITSKQITFEMRHIIPKIYEMVTKDTLIYFDELWKCMGNKENSYVIENIYNMFKTLRKKKAGIIIISQDICDLFNVDDGNFGKSILNNTNMKVLFKMEWADVEIFERLFINSEISINLRGLN